VKESVKKVDSVLKDLEDKMATLGDIDKHASMKLQVDENFFSSKSSKTAKEAQHNPLDVKQINKKRQLIKFPTTLPIFSDLKGINDQIYAEQWREAQNSLQILSAKYTEDDINQFYINLTWCLLSNNHSIRILEENLDNKYDLAEQEADTALTYIGFNTFEQFEENGQAYAYYMININALKVKIAGLVAQKNYKAVLKLYQQLLDMVKSVKQIEHDDELLRNVAMCGIVYAVRGENKEVIQACLELIEPYLKADDSDVKAVAAHGYKWLGVIELTQNNNEKKAQELFERALKLTTV
jgi:transposase